MTASAFPLVEGLFNPSIISKGTYIASVGSVKTGKDGLAGWQYASGIDLSVYKYLVIKFRRTPTVLSSFRFYDENNVNGTPCSCELKREKDIVIDLQQLKKENGQKLDLSHIYLAGFSLPENATVYVKEVFLSDDGETPTDIQSVLVGDEDALYYDLQGRPVTAPAHGFYINGSDGKKVFVQ